MKNRNTHIWLFLFLIAGVVPSCKIDKDNLPAVVDIPVAFRVQFMERFQPGPLPLELRLSSLEVMECTNYAVDYELDQGARRIHLTIKDLVLPEPCDSGFGVATSTLNLGPLENGEYELIINLKDVIQNEGLLVIRPESYTSQMETKDGLFISPNPLFRVPDNSIWGGIFPKADSLYLLAESFMADLQALAQPIHMPAGTYTPFTVNPDFTVTLTEPKAPGQGSTFVYRYTGDRSELINLVEYYRAAGDEGLPILLFDSEGYVF